MTGEKPDFSSLPSHMVEGARRYFFDGVEPGGFMRAVLENKLLEAFTRADSINIAALHLWVQWLNSELPFIAWGSPERVERWIANGGYNGMNKEDETSSEVEPAVVEVVCEAYNQALAFALDYIPDDPHDATQFLRQWREGDWDSIRHEYPEFDIDKAIKQQTFLLAHMR